MLKGRMAAGAISLQQEKFDMAEIKLANPMSDFIFNPQQILSTTQLMLF